MMSIKYITCYRIKNGIKNDLTNILRDILKIFCRKKYFVPLKIVRLK